MHDLDLSLSDISKMEGKASCDIRIRNGKVEKVEFATAEYKRFYTQAIRGKDVLALPQLTSRICGTCSNAHLLCSIKAVENALGFIPSDQTIQLRKLLNYGLMIRDHALHLYVFALPDLFNKDSILDFDEKIPEEHKLLDDTFSVKAAGNKLSKVVGGRSVHAPFPTVGGFIKLPKLSDLKILITDLENIRPKILELIEIFATKDLVLNREDLLFAALLDKEYSFLGGDIYASSGEVIYGDRFATHLVHTVIPYSQASGYKFRGKVYMVGALARLNLGKDKLHSDTKRNCDKYLKLFPSKNIYYNNLSQAIEILHAVDSSIEIIKNLKLEDEKFTVPQRREGIGIGVIEAPRGTLYYKLEIDGMGKVTRGQIIVPTGQNQIGIEESIRQYLEENIDKTENKDFIEHQIERIVRAYDPCLSCASHFLKFRYS